MGYKRPGGAPEALSSKTGVSISMCPRYSRYLLTSRMKENFNSNFLHFFIHDEVEVYLLKAVFRIGDSVILFRQRPKGFPQECDFLGAQVFFRFLW